MRQQKRVIVPFILSLFLVMVFCYGPNLFSQEMEPDTIGIGKKEFEPGEDISIDYRCSEANLPYLWIGVFKAGLDDRMMKGAGLSIKILGELNSSVLLNAPDTPGNYQVRLFSMQSDNVSVFHRLNFKVKEEEEDFTPCPGQPSISHMGQTYSTVVIGDQCWLRENLNVGKMIPGYTRMEDNKIIEKYCYNDNIDNCETYGGLYQWDELMQYRRDENTQGICPEGWHIPTQNDFRTLIDYLGGEEIAGEKLKKAGSIFWVTPETEITNESGFSALPGGIGGGDGTFNKLGNSAYFASTKHNGNSEVIVVRVFNPLNEQSTGISYTKDESWNLVITGNGTGPGNNNLIPLYKGAAVRCIKNKQEPPASPPASPPAYPPEYPPASPPDDGPEPDTCVCGFKVKPEKGKTGDTFSVTTTTRCPRVRWNWGNDGIWTTWREKKTPTHQYQKGGIYTVKMQVKDTDGIRDDCTAKVYVGPPEACFTVEPKKGPTKTDFDFDPRCSSDEEDPDSKLQVRWDWENDGKWDTGWNPVEIVKHQYQKGGIYTVKMQVEDTDGIRDDCTVEVYVGPPNACFTVDPTKGTTENNFDFDPKCSSDEEDPESKLKVCWDWENDGKWDTGWNPVKTIKHRYPKEGIYTVRMRVKDTDGITDDCTVEVYVGPPNACFTVAPTKGTTETDFLFDAGCSDDREDTEFKRPVKWDYGDGNGTDEWSTDKKANHKYSKEGTFTVTMQIKNKDNKIAKAAKTIEVKNDPSPSTKYPKREYLITPLVEKMREGSINRSLNQTASKGYKLISGLLGSGTFVKEENNNTIYPVEVLKTRRGVDIERMNQYANDHWVVLNGLFLLYMIQDKNAPLYEYTNLGNLANVSKQDFSQYKNYLPGGKNIDLFNEAGSKGWELIILSGNAVCRRIKNEPVKYKYMSFIFNRDNVEEFKKLGKEGWQYCTSPTSLNGLTGVWPVILKQRVGMGDSFHLEVVIKKIANAIPRGIFQLSANSFKQIEDGNAERAVILQEYGKKGWLYKGEIEFGKGSSDGRLELFIFQVPQKLPVIVSVSAAGTRKRKMRYIFTRYSRNTWADKMWSSETT